MSTAAWSIRSRVSAMVRFGIRLRVTFEVTGPTGAVRSVPPGTVDILWTAPYIPTHRKPTNAVTRTPGSHRPGRSHGSPGRSTATGTGVIPADPKPLGSTRPVASRPVTSQPARLTRPHPRATPPRDLSGD